MIALSKMHENQSWEAQSVTDTRLRMGMVGGGQGAFIGDVHRLAARLDGHIELVAGAAIAADEVSANHLEETVRELRGAVR